MQDEDTFEPATMNVGPRTGNVEPRERRHPNPHVECERLVRPHPDPTRCTT